MKLGNSFSGTLRTFAYFMSSGSHYMLKGIDYLSLYGKEPSAIEQAYAIFANVLELHESGQVLNATYAQKRATDYLRSYCDPSFKVQSVEPTAGCAFCYNLDSLAGSGSRSPLGHTALHDSARNQRGVQTES